MKSIFKRQKKLCEKEEMLVLRIFTIKILKSQDCVVNSLQNNKILDQSNLKEFADNILKSSSNDN